MKKNNRRKKNSSSQIKQENSSAQDLEKNWVLSENLLDKGYKSPTAETNWWFKNPVIGDAIYPLANWSNVRDFHNKTNSFSEIYEGRPYVNLTESLRSLSTPHTLYRPEFLNYPLTDFSKIGSIPNAWNVANAIKSPIAGLDAFKTYNVSHNKSYDNLLDIKFDNASKINELEKKLKQTTSKLKELENKNESLESQTLEYKTLMRDKKSEEDELLLYKQRGHIISRINGIELADILKSEEFFKEFEHLKDIDAVVISIDIRKSTELMLKAVTPQDFAIFITKLSELLSTIVTLNFGVFDKFTGDGILAFFPKFLTGDNALLYALKTATECHKLFEVHYKNHEFSFQVFNKSIGLGIGIECGKVALVNNGVELTVVGAPVVYACRLGGAPSYTTLIGQKAMQTIIEKYDNYVEVENDELEIKHEGVIGVYKLKKLKNLDNVLEIPDWSQYIRNPEEPENEEKMKAKENLDDQTLHND